MVVAGGDDASAGNSPPLGGSEGGSGGGGGGGWRESAAASKEVSDKLLELVGGFVARHGWTLVLLLLVWYNCKDAVNRRYRQWRNERSLADANRPDRRAVLDRERARAVTERQAEALVAARAAAAKREEKKLQRYNETTARVKDD
ncbi:unnamed protein product [Pylaiella littoralis]